MINDYIKRKLKETVENLYQVVDRNPYYPTQTTIPELNEYGLIFELSDGRYIHGMIYRFDANSTYASITDDGVDAKIFDLPSKTGSFFNTFKNKIEQHYSGSILNLDKSRKAFDAYVARLHIKN
jgi:hypothetical protein